MGGGKASSKSAGQAIRKGKADSWAWAQAALHRWNVFFFRESLVLLLVSHLIESDPLSSSRAISLTYSQMIMDFNDIYQTPS